MEAAISLPLFPPHAYFALCLLASAEQWLLLKAYLAHGGPLLALVDVTTAVAAREGGGARARVRVNAVYARGAVLAQVLVAVVDVDLAVDASEAWVGRRMMGPVLLRR